MRTHLTILSFLLLVTAKAQINTQALENAYQNAIENQGFEGVVLVADKGKVVFSASHQRTSEKFPTSVDTNSKFKIASITKFFTSVLIMQLVEEGRLKLDEPLEKLLPQYKGKNGDKITPHHLMLHTSGLPDPDQDSYLVPMSQTELIERYCGEKGDYKEPGTFNYNNLDFILLGAIIESVTGRNWINQLQSRILKPLKMANTGVFIPGAARADIVPGFEWVEDEKKPETNNVIANYGPSAAMYSTANDLLIFDQALHGDQLLNEDSKKQIYKYYPSLGYVAYGAWVFNSPFIEGQPLLFERRGGIQANNHVLLRALDDNFTIIILSNNSNFNPDTFGDETNLKEKLLRILYE